MATVQMNGTYRPILKTRGMSPTQMPDPEFCAFKNQHITDRDVLRQRTLDSFRNNKSKPMIRNTMTECSVRGLRTVPGEYNAVLAHRREGNQNRYEILRGTMGRVSKPAFQDKPEDNAPLQLINRKPEARAYSPSLPEQFKKLKDTQSAGSGAPKKAIKIRGIMKPNFEPNKQTGETDGSLVRKQQTGISQMAKTGHGDTPLPRYDYFDKRTNSGPKRENGKAEHMQGLQQNKKTNLTFQVQ